MKVVVTGATGFVGTALIPKLLADGHAVTALVRNAERARERLHRVAIVEADIETPGPWCDTLDGAGAIVHLAGESIGGKRWDSRVKQMIRDSRVESTRVIVEAIARTTTKPQALITPSGTDYYPYASRELEFDDDEVTEADAPAETTFLGRLCRDWEKEARAAEAFGVRVVAMRCGVILGKTGDTVARWRKPFDLFVGGRLGSGLQWVSWVHLDDAVRAYAEAVTDPRYRGAINLVTDSTRNADFSRALGKALHRPSWLPAPAFAIKAVLGEFGESILEGRRVVPAKLRELGFHWQHPTLADALAASV